MYLNIFLTSDYEHHNLMWQTLSEVRGHTGHAKQRVSAESGHFVERKFIFEMCMC